MISKYSLFVNKKEFIVFIYLNICLDCLSRFMKKTFVVTVRVDNDMYESLTTISEKEDRSIAWVARQLMSKGLESQPKTKKNKKK